MATAAACPICAALSTAPGPSSEAAAAPKFSVAPMAAVTAPEAVLVTSPPDTLDSAAKLVAMSPKKTRTAANFILSLAALGKLLAG